MSCWPPRLWVINDPVWGRHESPTSFPVPVMARSGAACPDVVKTALPVQRLRLCPVAHARCRMINPAERLSDVVGVSPGDLPDEIAVGSSRMRPWAQAQGPAVMPHRASLALGTAGRPPAEASDRRPPEGPCGSLRQPAGGGGRRTAGFRPNDPPGSRAASGLGDNPGGPGLRLTTGGVRWDRVRGH
jgi:hypothetical protein